MCVCRLQLVLCLLVCSLSMAVASEALQQRADVRLWQDLPSEVLVEINTHLSEHQRFAWYADPALDVAAYPGHTLELKGESLAAALDAYCAQAGLAWQQGERVVWIYQPADPDRLQELQAQLRSDDADQRIAARNALLDNPSPESLRLTLQALGDDNGEVADEALAGLHDFLHSSPDWGLSMQTGMTLFGDPDWPRNAIHPFLRYHMDIMAPWAALQIVAQDEAVAAAIAAAVERHSDDIGDHLVLGMAAACARLPEAAQSALGPWFDVGGGWQQRYISGRATAALAFAGAVESPSHAELSQAVETALEKMASGDRRERRDGRSELESALSSLAERGDDQARAFILAMVVDDEQSDTVREAALEALQALPHASLVEPLIALHASLDAGSDLAGPILNVLRQIDEPQALDYAAPALVTAVQAQIASLAEITDSRNHERRRRDIRRWLEDIASRRGELPIAVFTPLLHSNQTPQELRREMCNLLRNHRHPSMVAPLVQVYQHDEWPDVRRAAALALGYSRLPAAMEVLREGLADRRSPSARQAAVQAVARARDSESFATLVAMIEQSTSNEERIFLIQHLGVIRHPESADYLVTILTDDQRSRLDRQAAASALSLVPTAQAREALVSIIQGDHDLNLQRQTMDALSPRSHADVPIFAPILIEVLASRPQDDLLRMVVDNLVRCMVGLSAGHPLKQQIEQDLLDLVADREVSNNARRGALEAFQYSDQPAAVADRLESIQGNERNPIMRQFITRAVEELRSKAN
ncbi:MAG: HEAT repeat domain-containing protein [Planctomycetota bacterium]|nr:MAG: HEAT repeat domain-containing protein [Planctomycetota bacterium]